MENENICAVLEMVTQLFWNSYSSPKPLEDSEPMWLLTGLPLWGGSEAQLHRTESQTCLNDLAEMGRRVGELRVDLGSRPRPGRCGLCAQNSPLPTWTLIWKSVFNPWFIHFCFLTDVYIELGNRVVMQIINKWLPVFEPLIGGSA